MSCGCRDVLEASDLGRKMQAIILLYENRAKQHPIFRGILTRAHREYERFLECKCG